MLGNQATSAGPWETLTLLHNFLHNQKQQKCKQCSVFSPESQQWGTGCVSRISGWATWVSNILTPWYLTTLRTSCKNINGVFASEMFFLLYLFCVPNSTHFCTFLKTRRTLRGLHSVSSNWTVLCGPNLHRVPE